MPSGAERRTSPRIDLEIEVSFESDSNFYTGLTQDISSGGLFVSTHKLRKIGQRMMVKFGLPGSPQPVMVECEVRWLREPGPLHDHRSVDHPPGMGLKFLNLSPESRTAIDYFLRRRDSIFYDDE
ncbi:MAG TPA: TIGR02266 family protein [Polyangia bacterium]|nr:TIGR02266 family protein [Polyangia bacterium]